MPISSGPNRLKPAICFVFAVSLLGSNPQLNADTKDPVPKPRNRPEVAAPATPPASAITPSASAITEVAIIARGAWRAKPPLFAMKPHVPVSILVHHTAGPVNTKRDIFYKMNSLQSYSQKSAKLGNGRKRKAWADVPYHFYISNNGQIAEGRDIKFSGDTNTNYDPTGHIQLVLEGNFENTQPSAEQLKSLESLLVAVARKWKIPATEIRVHKHVAATLCPGKNLLDLFPEIKKRVAAQLGS